MDATDRRRRLWSGPFATYWGATSVSNLGSGVTLVALPILAAQQLGAGAAQLGILRALEAAPYALLALAAGQVVDRARPIMLMVVADVARACLLTATFALAATSLLGLTTLYVVVFAVGTFTLVYDVAQFTAMPEIVERTRLVEANAAVELARGAAFTLGPSFGGLLISVLRAGPALLADVVSYVYSAVSLATLRGRTNQRVVDRAVASRRAGGRRAEERAGAKARVGAKVRAGGMVDGARFVFGHAELRAMTAYLGVNNICNQAFLTGLIVYLEVDQRRPSSQVGLAFGAYGAGFLLAAVFAPAAGRRWGTGVNVTASSLVSAAGVGGLALSAALPARGWSALATVVLGALLVGFAAPIFNVQSVALRLSVTPPDRLGRVNALAKMVSQAALPLGALIAGALFSAFAPATAFAAIAAASFAATAILVFSPVVGSRRVGAADRLSGQAETERCQQRRAGDVEETAAPVGVDQESDHCDRYREQADAAEHDR
jgi:MFS family permease